MNIEVSKCDPLKRLVFKDINDLLYYAVGFKSDDNSLVLCVSSQIGCVENCKFCATGQYRFQRNLSKEEIKEEIMESFRSTYEYLDSTKYKKMEIIFEGMGEASYNIDNCFQAFLEIYPTLNEIFNEIKFRISTVGNIDLVRKYRQFVENNIFLKEKIKFEIKLSLHTPFDDERKYLMPNISKRYNIKSIIKEFYELANYLESKLVCNYLLINYPNGKSNYSLRHLCELSKLLNNNNTLITLSQYSDTGTDFTSPDSKIFLKFYVALKDKFGFDVDLIDLLGKDINSACGMLHYE